MSAAGSPGQAEAGVLVEVSPEPQAVVTGAAGAGARIPAGSDFSGTIEVPPAGRFIKTFYNI